MMTLYLAGPMTGYDSFNFPAFMSAARKLRDKGYTVINPAERDMIEDGFNPDTDTPKDIAHYMAHDLPCVCMCDGVAVLPGWKQSKGACIEVSVARAVGKPIYDAYTMLPVQNDSVTPQDGEVRVTNATTGGEKGSKLARFDLLPWDALWEVAELFGIGSVKYEERNWERGYKWSLSFAAMVRHEALFWDGEDYDPETKKHHLTSVVFHALALLTFSKKHPTLDDRPNTKPKDTA